MRRSITAVVMLGICLVSGPVSAQVQTDVTVVLTGDPTVELDFGSVQVDESNKGIVKLINNSGETLNITLENFYDQYYVFSTSGIIPPLASGDSYDLPVWFSPSSAGDFFGTVTLKYTGLMPSLTVVTITLKGVGEEPGFDLIQAIDNLVVFTAAALVSGDLEGVSKGKSHRKGKKRGRGRHRRGKDRKAAHHEREFLKWILKAEKLILAGEFDKAHHLLSGVLRKVDGAPRPPDTVVGTAAGGVADQIRVILAALAG